MALRATRQAVEALVAGDSGATRVTRQSAQVLGGGVGAARVTRQVVEALGAGTDGAARVTRQSAQVLGSGIGKVRVGRQVIEVLADENWQPQVYDKSATSPVDLTQASIGGHIYAASITNSLSVSDTAPFLGAWRRSASSPISVTQTAGASAVRERECESATQLADIAEKGGRVVLSATNDLSLEGTGYRCRTLSVSSTSAVPVEDVVGKAGPIDASASSTISLADEADHRVYVRQAVTGIEIADLATSNYCHSVGNTIELTSAAVEGQLFAEVTSAISLTATACANSITVGPGPQYAIRLPPTAIGLGQTVGLSTKILSAVSVLSLADSVGLIQPWCVLAQSELQTINREFDPTTGTAIDVIAGLQDTATAGRSVNVPFVSHHYLQFGDAAAVVHIKANSLSASADSGLDLDQDLYTNVTGNAVSHLTTLTDRATVDRCVPATTEIDPADSADVTIIRRLEAESDLTVAQGLSFSLTRYAGLPGGEGTYVRQRRPPRPELFTYTPFVGEGAPGAPTPPPTALAGPVGGVASFQLCYPAVGAITDSMTLGSPSFGNKDRLSFNRVLRETRGGTLVCYADPMWPKIQTLVLSFSGLRKAEKDSLLAFLDAHLGLEIGLIDWERRYWKGVIVAPDEPVVQDDRDSYTASFQFEGQLDPSWTP